MLWLPFVNKAYSNLWLKCNSTHVEAGTGIQIHNLLTCRQCSNPLTSMRITSCSKVIYWKCIEVFVQIGCNMLPNNGEKLSASALITPSNCLTLNGNLLQSY